MRAGEFEQGARWVGGTIHDVVSVRGRADKVMGVFEVGMKLPADRPRRSRGQLLQELRNRVIALEIFGENPSFARANIQGTAPPYAKDAAENIVAINYRPVTERDMPVWPGAIAQEIEGVNDHGDI